MSEHNRDMMLARIEIRMRRNAFVSAEQWVKKRREKDAQMKKRAQDIADAVRLLKSGKIKL